MIMKSSNGNYPFIEFKNEQLRLTRAIRAISKEVELVSERVHFFGFDIDTVTGGGLTELKMKLLTDLSSFCLVSKLRCKIYQNTSIGFLHQRIKFNRK